MRKHILWVILFFITKLAPAQSLITGRVVSTDKAGVTGMNILVHPKNNPTGIISYAISDAKGNFRLEFTSKDDSVGISTRSLTHRDTTIWIANRNQELKLVLPVHVREIKEVQVNSRPITSKKDTLTYLVSAFAQVKDQSIGDVIGKMPGFEVDPDGKIFYQGNPIQKYYIEGLDLLENRYAIANKNLPHGSVGSVEVLENHQPIKALQSNVFSNGTSLNLKLKKNVAVTGTARTGIGLPWIARDVNITPMLFNAKQQLIASFQSNNIGDDLNTQNNPLQFSNGVLDGMGNLKPELLGITTINKPQIDRQKYLDNNANLLSYNHLLKITSLTELKINAGFYHDQQHESGTKISKYYLSDNEFNLKEIADNHYYSNNLSANFTLTQNATKRYLKNQLSFNRFWDYETGIILNPDKLEQKAETPHTSVSNSFDLLIPHKKNFFRIYSTIDYNNSPQKLSFWPGVFVNEINDGESYLKTVQNFTQEELIGQNFLRFTLSRKPWSFDTEVGLKLELQNQRSFIEKDNQILDADSLNNDYRWSSYELYCNENFRYEKGNLRLGIETPFRLLFYEFKDVYHHSFGPSERFLFSPRFWINYDLNGYWSGSASVRHSKTLGEASQLTQGYIITGYRNMQKRSDKLDDKENFSYSAGLKYKNPVSGFFSSWTWIHNQSNKSLLYKNKLLAGGLFFYEAVEDNNRAISDNVATENSWFNSRRRITFNLKGNYLRSKREYLFNETKGWLQNQTILLQPGIGFNCWKKLGLDYNMKFSLSMQRNMQANTTIIGQTHKFSFYYYPSNNHWLGANLEYYLYGQQQEIKNGEFFTNITYTFKPENSRFQYKIRCSNLLNSSEIVDYIYSDVALFESHYSIRPREIMFTVSFALNQLKSKN